MIEEKTNILYMSDGEEELNKDLFNNIDNKFSIIHIRTFRDLKVNFNHSSIIFLNINSDEFYNNILLYIRENKHNQKILTTINKKDTFLLLESIEHKVTEFIFKPINQEELKLKFEEFDRELNFMSKVYKIRSLESKDLKKEINQFYQKDLIIINTFFTKFEAVLKNILNFSKYNLYRIELLSYFSDFVTQNKDERLSYISDFALDMLYRSNYDRIEDSMIRPIIEEIIVEFKEIYGKENWAENFIDKIRIFFEMEIRLMGLNLKYEIQQRLKDKERDLHSNSLHILMSSSSDKLNNYVSVIDSKCYAVNRLIKLTDDENTLPEKKEKAMIAIKSKGMPLNEFKDFLKKQSKIFTSFKDEISNQSSIRDLSFLIEFAYINGMKVKYKEIKINFENKIKEELLDSILVNTNENLILASVYAVIENAIEANCKSITIELSKDNSYISLGIKNDGEKMTKDVEKNLFKKFFTTKNQYGLGLFTAKEWLTNVDYKFNYNSRKKMFIIGIPIFSELK